jgi:hypothetical protein
MPTTIGWISPSSRYETLAQCQTSNAGKNGTCARDPFYKDPKEALAQAPKGRVAKQPVQH